MARSTWFAATLCSIGVVVGIVLLWQVFFWVPTEAIQGVIQRTLYIHFPSALVAFGCFGIVALASAVYLWLGDERADMAAVSAAEVGMVFMTIVLTTGPLWGRIAWGTFWDWAEPRLTFSLLLWFIYLGYFMVRSATENPEKGRRFAAVVGLVGVAFIPIIHMSVYWFRSLHPEPVILKPDGPTMHPDMLTTFLTGLVALVSLAAGLLVFRYKLERTRARLQLR